MQIAIRYTKGTGNGVLYVRVRNISGQYYNFSTLVFEAVESLNTKIFMSEFQDTDQHESLFTSNPQVPTDNQYIVEVIDSTDNTVIAYTTTEIEECKNDIIYTIDNMTTGAGDIPVNHNYGGIDNLRYVDNAGIGVGGATVLAYTKEDYDNGNTRTPFIKAKTSTLDDGRWYSPIMLSSGVTYTIVIYKHGITNISTVEITI